ncbi:ankyrin repeat-containing domain protein [Aspergillus falconensis]
MNPIPGSGSDLVSIFDMDLDTEEDVDACLAEFVRLARLDAREEARQIAEHFLWRHIDFFPVFAEMAAFFIVLGDMQAAADLVIDLSARKIMFAERDQQDYVQMVALFARGRLPSNTLRTFTGGNRVGEDMTACIDVEEDTYSLFHEIDYTSVAQIQNIEMRLYNVLTSGQYRKLDRVVVFATSHMKTLVERGLLREAVEILLSIAIYLNNNAGCNLDVWNFYTNIRSKVDQQWKASTANDDIQDMLLLQTSLKTALFIGLHSQARDSPVSMDELARDIDDSRKELFHMIADREPSGSLIDGLLQDSRVYLRSLPSKEPLDTQMFSVGLPKTDAVESPRQEPTKLPGLPGEVPIRGVEDRLSVRPSEKEAKARDTQNIALQGEENGPFPPYTTDTTEHPLLEGLKKTVKFLLNQHSDTNIRDGIARAAAGKGYNNNTQLLLEDGADIHTLGGVSLAVVAKLGHESDVQLLLKNGANINASGGQALRNAAKMGHEKVVQLLLAYGANIKAFRGEALASAAEMGHEKVVQLLLENGANINASRGEALARAAEMGHEKVIQLLLKNGANINTLGGQVLARAAEMGHEKVVQLLLENGADVNAAAEMGHEKVVQLLLENGADVNASDGDALARAAEMGHEKVVQLLLENGADVKGQGGNALHAASEDGKETARLLRR